MADAKPLPLLQMGTAPRNIVTGLRLDKEFYPDGSPRPARTPRTPRTSVADADPFIGNKPGFRDAAAVRGVTDAGQAAKDAAYSEMCRDLQDAWKPDHQRAADARQVTADAACPAGVDPRDFAYHQRCLQDSEAWRTPPTVFDAAAVSTPPSGAFAPTGYGARAGDVCSLNGAPGNLVERDGWLFCEVTPVGATRSGTSSGDALTGRALVDSEWHALQERTQNAWRT
jgi:hypothetical protein